MDNIQYLGYTSQVVIHAHWPVYPVGYGWEFALLSLCQFPPESKFKIIDNIDHCLLFFVGDPKSVEDKFSKKHFHVALWNEDITKLYQLGHISTISGNTPQEWTRIKSKKLKELFLRNSDGTYALLPAPQPNDFTEKEALLGLISDDGIQLSDRGFNAFQQFTRESKDLISEDIMKRARTLILNRQHDAAVREACVLVEASLRRITGSSKFGMRLVEDFCEKIANHRSFYPDQVKTFRIDLRTTFKYIRNEYIHNLLDITQDQCLSILFRISYVYEGIKECMNIFEADSGNPGISFKKLDTIL